MPGMRLCPYLSPAARSVSLTLLAMFAVALPAAAADGPLLLQRPTVSRTHIVFSYAGDLWTVERAGGDARRLTSGIGRETDPFFSPDGTQVAFTGEYDGNVDIYVLPAAGGPPRRLTWHPGPDEVAGWTPDGERILFRSGRTSHHLFTRLLTIPATGGQPADLPLPRGVQGSYSPDGKRLAYVPTNQWQAAWKRYRGGQTTPIWIADLSDSRVEVLPRQNSNDSCPMWFGTVVYFLSDRDGPVGLYAYDTASKQVRSIVPNDGLDFKWASAGPDAIVYEQFGALFLLDPSTGQSRAVPVRVTTDLPQTRPHYAKVASKLGTAALSPSGVRAAFEVRGEIVTVPADKGDIRNLTRSPGVADRDPAWSPDGQRLAWFSDESGEYVLHLAGQRGLGEVKKIPLGTPASFFYGPRWSPDGRMIAFTDKRLNVWYVDVAGPGAPIKVDTDRFDRPDRQVVPNWSPDSRWLTYTKVLPNQMSAVFVYSLATKKATQVTDGMSDALFPAFDKNGKHLYFTASTDVGPGSSWLDMSGMNRPVSRTAYVVVLRKVLPSPLVPESDDEKTAAEKKAEKEEEQEEAGDEDGKPAAKDEAKSKSEAKDGGGSNAADVRKSAAPDQKKAPRVDIDLDRLTQRTLALPIPAENYVGLVSGKPGVFFLLQAPRVLPLDGPTPIDVKRFVLKTRKLESILSGASAVSIAANGEKLLYKMKDEWAIQGAESAVKAGEVKAGEGRLKVTDAEIYVDPRAEWRQMYRETWRLERDFLYDPAFHGLDLAAAEKKYAPWVEGLGSRADLNYLFEEMLGELTLGHVFVGGGDGPEPPKVKGGLLGADFTVENGRYRFARVLDGEGWNPELRAPLTQPGVNVTPGEYLLAVNGRELRPPESVFAPFESTAGKSVVIRVGPNADGRGARDVTVVPVDDEFGLRNLAWIESNRRKVDELSGGRLAYVYLPDTGGGGYRNFNRYFFAQVGKQGVVLDERFNGGGLLADYIIDALRRPVMSYVVTREGDPMASPAASIYGPKVMIINESAGSGGDAMPWYFRRAGIGKLVGTRTWGGLVGIWSYPALMDGGFVTAPRGALYGLEGKWEVENVGISPDVEVELDPALARQGRDPQLERAVQVAMEELGKTPLPTHARPPYPNYHKSGTTPVAASPTGERRP
jgi:tricorn protease